MFCPVCKDEFRAGFTRCEGCDADLVEELGAEPVRGAPAGGLVPDLAGPKSDYCGFLELDEARAARDLLWNNGIPSEVNIRPAPGSRPGDRLQEEFWLQVPAARVKAVIGLLGFHEGDVGSPETMEGPETRQCAGCGASLPGQEPFCPHCGAAA